MISRYEKRQQTEESNYKKVYNAWIETLSEEEKADMSPALLKPHVDGKAGGVADCDLADSNLASYNPHEDDGQPEEKVEVTSGMSPEEVWEILRRVIGEIKSSKNPGLTIECVALASGLSYLGDSQQEIATRHGVTRAAVSKRCVEFCNAIGLDPSRAMRSLDAREAYRDARNKSLGK
ncbi:MAG: hypothetical protein CMA70_04505 [Euryarchaeota archaeon]|nr:hypothetical protein [Euryarchaeota archaeon]|tara:strand:+ start:189 stop:722 length:534 start_codon:yes stop_codon:yes gene_type:complete